MKSPFPGMDPYLEQSWRDVHHRLCTYACDDLQPQVRPALLARIEERLVVEEDLENHRSIYPDVRVVERRHPFLAPGGDSPVGIAEPLLITLKDDPTHEGFIQIIDPATGGRLITVIEFLSISNKTSEEGMSQFRKKQSDAVAAGISTVEIDLLRAGDWVLQASEAAVPADLRKPYRACVKRGWRHGEWEYYHLPIRERLPRIRIPLRQHDPDAILDLQLLLDRIYVNGGYDEIDYSVPPIPPLDAATVQWAADLIANRK